ncbi:MAG: hypothetical protein A3G34_08840 [Candidatus Lindowbacteria bacterium RIFCSPLOWO2_12_FULL_62_27]|nr:MAG: hypothetical protein A3G34_08840 [Candidatus Lindowbacteria bacterium RIFCSPLOWO2_12_FULL_62_27]
MFEHARLGLVPYRSALALQERLVEMRAQDRIPDTLLILEHPPTITLGAAAPGSHVLTPRDTLSRLGIDVVETRRGGNVTYHGPGQLVAYPIFKLSGPYVLRWVRFLEQCMIDTLRAFGLDAAPSESVGVRVGGRKIGFVGIKISRSVSYHGVSLNVDPDLKPFSHIVPCACAGDAITHMEQELGRAPSLERVANEFVRAFQSAGGPSESVDADAVWQTAFPDGVPVEMSALPRRGLPDRVGPKPYWLRRPIPGGPVYVKLRDIMDTKKLHTVCESAHCPNLGECWGRGTATFMILGDVCTRACGFCAVTPGRPAGLDEFEPARVAAAVQEMGLRHVVITSVNRDDAPDGGAEIWARTIRRVRRKNPETQIEVLIPDFLGDGASLKTVLDAGPDVLNHNLETVPRLYPTVRPQARYERSLELLSRAKDAGFRTKTGLMLGIGEQPFEILRALRDIAARQVDILTLGQYLRPSGRHLPVDRWVHPSEFEHWKRVGLKLGFKHVESGPLVRSSYHAEAHAGYGRGHAENAQKMLPAGRHEWE